MKKIFLILILCFMILSCVEADYSTSNNINKVQNNMQYFKDKYGNCFAALSSYNSYGIITSIATIPCNDDIR